ncbi:hypothetical protein L541_1868 [Bordetella hinzii CA90 BAL1384]|nr:hypothetical protein L541_1868 [Bordetella hinzii CA90 BAL1384]
MLLVSHDRHLLRTTVDSFWIVSDGQVREFDGDLEDYRDWLNARNAEARAEAAPRDSEGVDRKAQRRQEAEQRQKLAALRKPLQARLGKVESEMDKLRARLQALDALVADAELYSDARRAERQQVMAEHGELGKRLNTLEEEWLEIQTSLEDIEHGAGS